MNRPDPVALLVNYANYDQIIVMVRCGKVICAVCMMYACVVLIPFGIIIIIFITDITLANRQNDNIFIRFVKIATNF